MIHRRHDIDCDPQGGGSLSHNICRNMPSRGKKIHDMRPLQAIIDNIL